MVSNGSENVSGREGDDIICLTRVRAPGYRSLVSAYASGGDGNDLVDATAIKAGIPIDVSLGDGADQFIGGAGDDFIDACAASDNEDDVADPADTSGDGTDLAHDPDIISSGGGADYVEACAEATPDTFDLGDGHDRLEVSDAARFTGHTVAGGDSGNGLIIEDLGTDAPSDWVFDLAAGAATVNGAMTFTWDSFDALELPLPGRSLRVQGTQRRNYVVVKSGSEGMPATDVSLDLGEGNDIVQLAAEALATDSRLDLGGGEDELRTGAYDGDWDKLQADLQSGALQLRAVGGGTTHARLLQTENLAVVARVARVRGSAARNRLRVQACDAHVSGRSGADNIVLLLRRYDCKGLRRFRAEGGPGNDRLKGTDARDVLIGGRGHDSATGKGKRDQCDAEHVLGCEERLDRPHSAAPERPQGPPFDREGRYLGQSKSADSLMAISKLY